MHRTTLQRHLKQLAGKDDDVASALAQVGMPPPRVRPAGFETFLSTIVSQQISTAAAKAIWGRVIALMPAVNATEFLSLSPQALRTAGLSARKVEYARGLAQAVCDGSFSPEILAQMDDESAIAAITALRGFGRWSAEIYLMFSLRRKDVFPADDLALQMALQRLKGMDNRPSPKQARELTAHWSPYRSAGSLFLWHYYHGAPDMED